MRKNRIRLTVALALLPAIGTSLSLPISARSVLLTTNVASARSTALDPSGSEMREVIESYSTDRGNLSRTYPDGLSPLRRARFKQFYEQWRESLSKLNFDAMSLDGRIDYVLFKNHLNHELLQLDIQAKQLAEAEALIPFAKTIFELEETRRRMEPVSSARVAAQLTAMNKQIEALRQMIAQSSGAAARAESNIDSKTISNADNKSYKTGSLTVNKNVANRTVATIGSLRNTLRNWFDYYNGYDPMFTWWVAEPYRAADQSLQSYASFMSERVAGVRFVDFSDSRSGPGILTGTGGPGAERGQRPAPTGRSNARAGDSSDVVGDPIGRDALLVAAGIGDDPIHSGRID